MTVDIIGGGVREGTCGEMLASSEICSRFSRIAVLPIPTTRNGKDINGMGEPLEGLLPLASGTLFCAYGLPSAISARLCDAGAVVADVAEDEVFTLENARLTAECTLAYIMNKEERAVRDLRIGIVGYGRIGGFLLELLLFHGAFVRVYTRKSSTLISLLGNGVDAQTVAEGELSDLDILINTAPAHLFTKSQTQRAECEILELAPGENFPYAKNVTRLPSLPARAVPKSAGRLYAEAVKRILDKDAEGVCGDGKI